MIGNGEVTRPQTHRNRTSKISVFCRLGCKFPLIKYSGCEDLMAGFRIGDYIVMLDKGKVLFSGTAEDFRNTDIDLVRRFVDKGLKK